MPKGELRIGEIPILRFVMNRLGWEGPTMLVTGPGRERPPGVELFGREVVDPVAGQGPLRGLHTALAACGTDVLVVATVDMPLIGREQLEWLIAEQARRAGSWGLMLRRGTPAEFEPFPSAWRAEARELLEQRLATGERRMRSLAEDGRIVVTDAPEWDEATWTNLNRPEDLRDFVATLR